MGWDCWSISLISILKPTQHHKYNKYSNTAADIVSSIKEKKEYEISLKKLKREREGERKWP